MRKRIIIALIFSCYTLYTSAQAITGLKAIVADIDTLRTRLPIEKLYLQLDKPYYSSEDTLRFKAYLLNADYLTPSARSGLLYVELDNGNNQMVKRIMVPITSGIGWGDIALNKREIPDGSYTLRAYTNWMRNFGEDYIFKKSIDISGLSGAMLVNANFKLDSVAGKAKVQAALYFAGLDKDAFRLKDMQLKVMNGNHNLYKDRTTTGMDGSMNINFDLSDKTPIKNLYLLAQKKDKGADTANLIIPVILNRPENTDIQFMPEGGQLVAGIPAKVGFKAIGENGKGTDVSGKIVDSKQREITKIQSVHKGMGSFELTPETGENYTAVINLPNKTTKSYVLPKVNPIGTALRIIPKGEDSLEVVLSLKSEVKSPASAQDSRLQTPDLNNYYLIGQSRGVICYAASIGFKQPVVIKIVAKNLFPTGIARFTLFNPINQPTNERIVYINNNDNLSITVNTNKPNYNTRDSIALNIQVKDKANNPVRGIFSLAVTDNNQVTPDSTGGNIINNLLFTSDLKGTIEEPGWYFDADNKPNNRTTALDNLLLTQGWVGYDWSQVFNPPLIQPKFPAEKEFTIQGKLTNVLNKPLKKAGVSMLQKQPFLSMDTVTDNNGRFIFRGKNLFPPDSAYYMIEATKNDGQNKTFNVGIDVDEFVNPVFTPAKYPALPWYVNTDTLSVNNMNTKAAQLNAQESYVGEGHLLKEVNIKDKKIIPDSHNLNGPGEADFILDEKEVSAAKKMTLFELLKHKFKDFHYMGERYYFDYHGNWIYDMVIDGVYIKKNNLSLGLYMNGLTAEDIKGVEVMFSSRYASTYFPHFIEGSAFGAKGNPRAVPPGYQPGEVFLEVTTYTGLGAFFRHIPGKYVYKPIGFSLPKEFYRPRYTVETQGFALGTDLRSTIHWEPNVVTDKNGNATVSFFSADKAADYNVVMEGTDLNGNLGYKRQKIKVDLKLTGK